MQKFLQEYETYKIFWDFEIQTDHGQETETSDNYQKADHQLKFEKKEKKKRDTYLDLVWELRKLWSIRVAMISPVCGKLGTVPKSLKRCIEFLEIGGRIETTYTTAFLYIGKNTEQSPGDLKSLLVTQTSVKEHQLKLKSKLARSIILIHA